MTALAGARGAGYHRAMRVLLPLVAAAITACSFVPSGTAGGDGGGGPGDGGAGDGGDAAASCAVVASPVMSGGEVLGSTGGGTARPPLVCPTDELPVGASFDLTDGVINNHGGQRVVAGVHLRCARVAMIGGVATATPTGTLDHHGDTTPNCNAYDPATRSAEATCPAGTLLVGFDANRPDDVLFNHVALRCAAVAADGTVATQTTAVDVAGTGGDTNRPQTARCPAGTIVVGAIPQSGCGLDGLTLLCAAPLCR